MFALPDRAGQRAQASRLGILGRGPIACDRLATDREWLIKTDLGRRNGVDKWWLAMLKSAMGALRGHTIMRGAKTLLRSPHALRAILRDKFYRQHAPHALAVCAIFKDEAKFLDEWNQIPCRRRRHAILSLRQWQSRSRIRGAASAHRPRGRHSAALAGKGESAQRVSRLPGAAPEGRPSDCVYRRWRVLIFTTPYRHQAHSGMAFGCSCTIRSRHEFWIERTSGASAGASGRSLCTLRLARTLAIRKIHRQSAPRSRCVAISHLSAMVRYYAKHRSRHDFAGSGWAQAKPNFRVASAQSLLVPLDPGSWRQSAAWRFMVPNSISSGTCKSSEP